MILLRLLFILTSLALVVSGGMYVFTRDLRYLRLARQVLRFVAFLLLVLAAMYVLERYVLVAWGV